MGTWGAGLFSDDTALDIKHTWEQLYKRFGEPLQATRELLQDSNITSLDDIDDDVGPIIVLALAMCQWKYGCLLSEVKARALEIIKHGTGLDAWEDSKSRERRRAVYQQIAATLQSPQPPLKRIKTLTPADPVSFERGQLLSYRCHDGDLLLLWVTGHYRHMGQRLPLCAAMDWKGPALPDAKAIRALKPIYAQHDQWNAEWFAKHARELGEEPPPSAPGLPWSKFAPCDMVEHGFEANRIQVVPGEWHWDLAPQNRGPYVPAWIELGSRIVEELSTTVAFTRTLERFDQRLVFQLKLPDHPRRLAERTSEPRPLGIDVKLPMPKPRKKEHFYLATLRRSKHQPMAGDIFLVNVLGKRWVVGRVIVNNGRFVSGPADILVYFYKRAFTSVAEIETPMTLKLLIPPCGAHALDWQSGEFFHVANRPLEAGELPARHVFGPGIGGYYRDAWGVPTRPPEWDELVGTTAIGGLGHDLAVALGLA